MTLVSEREEKKTINSKNTNQKKNFFLVSKEWLSLSVKLPQGGKNEQF